MKRLHFFWFLLLNILAIQGYGQSIGSPNKTLEARGGFKANQYLILPDTTFPITCNDTNRIAIVNGFTWITYKDPISGCAKWKIGGGGEGGGCTILGDTTIVCGVDTLRVKPLYIEKDLPAAYFFRDGDTIRDYTKLYIDDSVKVRKSGDTLFFPNGDTVLLVDASTTQRGFVNTTTQGFAGQKNFIDKITLGQQFSTTKKGELEILTSTSGGLGSYSFRIKDRGQTTANEQGLLFDVFKDQSVNRGIAYITGNQEDHKPILKISGSGIKVNQNRIDVSTPGPVPDSAEIVNNGVGGTSVGYGTSGQRPILPDSGTVRWNTTIDSLEVFDGLLWKSLGYTGSGGSSTVSTGYGISGDGSGGDPLVWDSSEARAQIAQVARDSAQFYNVGNTGVRLGQLYENGFGVSRLIGGSDVSVTKNLDSSITISLTGDYIANQYAVKENKSAWITRYRGDSARFDSYVTIIGNGAGTQRMFFVSTSGGNVAFGVRNDGTLQIGNGYRAYPVAATTGTLSVTANGIKFEANTTADRGFSHWFTSRNTRAIDSTTVGSPRAGNVVFNENFTVTSGTGTHYQATILGTINQTGATGETGGILIDQTVTSAADYAAIRVKTGKSVFRSINLSTAGDKINIATGSNASIGTATLVAGTVTVNTTAVTASSIIMVSCNTPGGTVGFLSAPVGSIVAGTSFVINSSSNTDTSTVNWWIIN